MGQPVVHFEVIGKDGAKLQKYYADLFGWKISADNEMNYEWWTARTTLHRTD